MKRLIPFILLLFSLADMQAAKTKFFITYSIDGDSLSKKSVEGIPGVFITWMSDALLKEFKCTEYNSVDAIRTLLGLERSKQLVGSSTDEKGLKDIAGAMGADYLIYFNIKALPGNVMSYTIGCIDILEKNPKYKGLIAHVTGTNMNNVSGWDKMLKDNVDDIIDQLARFEICPYKGPVNIQVLSEKNEEKKEEYDVYCSKMDRKYTKTTLEEKKSEAIWTLDKKKKDMSFGTVKYTLAEKTAIDEINDCYKCDALTSARRTYHELSTAYLEINGLSKESKSEGQYVQDCRITLNFLEDGTYTLFVKAASYTGSKQVLKERNATGECGALNDPPENYTQEADIGIRETLGPFPGTGKDKNLTQKQTIEKEDPVTKEITTITFDFNLTRE